MPCPTPCDHTGGRGLCDDCQASFEEDPSAWEEFGEHPQGRANWAAELQADAEFRTREAARPQEGAN